MFSAVHRHEPRLRSDSKRWQLWGDRIPQSRAFGDRREPDCSWSECVRVGDGMALLPAKRRKVALCTLFHWVPTNALGSWNSRRCSPPSMIGCNSFVSMRPFQPPKSKQTSVMLVDWAAHCVGLWFSPSYGRHPNAMWWWCVRGPHTALQELVTRVARLEVHIKVTLANDDEQLAELKM